MPLILSRYRRSRLCLFVGPENPKYSQHVGGGGGADNGGPSGANMAPSLIILVAVIYLAVAADLYRQRQHGLALAFLAYAVSNVGLFIAAR